MWSIISERSIFETDRGWRFAEQTVQLPDGRVIDDYLRISGSDFVTVLAFDFDEHVLCLEQYKHGVGRSSHTLPGGMIEQDEDPLEAAKRELKEETGYVSKAWTSLGSIILHGNQRVATGHHFLAMRCEQQSTILFEEHETFELRRMNVNDLRKIFLQGEFPIASHCAIIGQFLAREVVQRE